MLPFSLISSSPEDTEETDEDAADWDGENCRTCRRFRLGIVEIFQKIVCCESADTRILQTNETAMRDIVME